MGFGKFLEDAAETASTVVDRLGNSKQIINNDFNNDGFIVSESPSADGLGLPSSKVPSGRRDAKQKRKIIHWFVPEFGVVKMYVNPQSIKYTERKLITPTLTKGGYVINYWGEELTTLSINGTTGSSGIEGLNVLREIYRSEQLAFDAVGLSLAANNQVNGLNDLLDSVTTTALGGKGSVWQDLVGDSASALIGSVSPTANMLPQNIPSLGSLALGVEMYYDGWVFRGFFTSFGFDESVGNLGMFNYDINFTVTQKRGYRTNFMPWHRSAIDGPSNNSSAGGVPLTFRLQDKK